MYRPTDVVREDEMRLTGGDVAAAIYTVRQRLGGEFSLPRVFVNRKFLKFWAMF